MNSLNSTWGEPYKYKGVLIYPVQMKYMDKLYQYVHCLLIEKNKFPDVRIIKMSYLRFLFELSHGGNDYKICWRLLTKLLILVFKHKFHFVSKENKIFIKIGNKLLSERDFDEIRKLFVNKILLF